MSQQQQRQPLYERETAESISPRSVTEVSVKRRVRAAYDAAEEGEGERVHERTPLLGGGGGGVGGGPVDANGKKTYSVEEMIEAAHFGKFQYMLLLLTGMVWMADAMEVLLLSFLSGAVGCLWDLSSFQESLLVTVVFIGIGIGSTVWGIVSDRYGRRAGYLGSALFTLIMGALSSLSPNYEALLFMRAMTGVGLGGSHVAYALFSEFLSTAERSFYLLVLGAFWSIGCLLETGLVWAILPTHGWRWLLFTSALPVLSIIFLFPLLPESPRYLVLNNRHEEAMAVLHRVARMNGTTLPDGHLTYIEPPKSSGGVLGLLTGSGEGGAYLRRTTLLLWFIWFVLSFLYYGVVLLVTELYADDLMDKRCHRKLTSAGVISPNKMHSHVDCQWYFTYEDYKHTFINSVTELPGIVLAGVALKFMGRKTSMTIFLGLAAVGFASIGTCTGRTFESVMLGLIRGCVTAAYQIVWIYTPEVYPTAVRSTGLGTCSTMSRVGGMSTPYVAQMLTRKSVDATLVIYASLSGLASLFAQLLQVETSNKNMPDTLQEAVDENNQQQQHNNATQDGGGGTVAYKTVS